jgi:hypothetical protein
MAYIKDYEFDLFISYAHVDNTPYPGQADGWIEQFYKNLKVMLDKRIGRTDVIKIWWDNKKLDGSVLFDQSIQEGIKKSAIMICLNSPGYQASDYCKQEMELFYTKVQREKAGLKVGGRSRIINVLLNNIPFEEWPKELEGASGFPFHDAEEKEQFGDTVKTSSAKFETQIKALRDAIWHLLDEFPNRQMEMLVQAGDNKAFTIFIGEVADTLRSLRKRIISELEKSGYNVVTGIPPPHETDAHEQAINDALKNSDLLINLLDDCPGREIIDAPELWYPQKQAELAMLSGKSQMIWIPPETDFEEIIEEKYKQFLYGLETGTSVCKGFEFVRGSKSTLAKEIIDFAGKLKVRTPVKTAGGKFSVLLDTHYKDQVYASDLYNELLYNQIMTFINPQEDDPRKNINTLAERISQVKKVIFLYGSVSKEWITERIHAALHLIIDNDYPVESCYIFLAPPHKKADEISIRQKILKIDIVDSSNKPKLDREILQPFIDNLKAVAV